MFSRNTIGPKTEKCPHCGEDYATGRKEWAQMLGAERRDYHRRTGLRCLAVFVFWVMGFMLAAFFVTGAIFQTATQTEVQYSLALSLIGGLALAARVFQLAMRRIKQSLEREPFK